MPDDKKVAEELPVEKEQLTRYKVVGAFSFLGHNPGESFDGPLPEEILEDAALEGGVIAIVDGKDEGSPAAVKVFACPACKAEGKKKAVQFSSHDGLVTHYHEQHPALEPPAAKEA